MRRVFYFFFQLVFLAGPKPISSSIWVMAAVLSRGRSRSRMISSFSIRSPRRWRPPEHPNAPQSPPTPTTTIAAPAPTPSLKPKGLSNHSVVGAISGACLPPSPSSSSYSSSPNPPSSLFLPSRSPPHPSTPTLLPPTPPKCIPAWQTTWDFTSPLKSAASGNHSSPCNILVFKGIRDWGGNQPGNLLYSSSLLLLVNSVGALQGDLKKLFFFFLKQVIITDHSCCPLS